jgi:hypothetical protein
LAEPSAEALPEVRDGRAEMARRARERRRSRLWQRASMGRAVVEGVALFSLGRIVSLLPIALWPGPLFVLAPVVWLGLMFLAPVWAASRVVSTRREKMSRRFWRLGPLLALLCALAAGALALITRTTGSIGEFARGEAILLFALVVYFTIAVVCTRLAYGGFLRFTMPAGDGRVTL